MRKFYFKPYLPTLDIEMITCAVLYLAAAILVLYKNETTAKDRFVSILMAMMIFAAFCDLFVTFSYVF